VASSTSSSDCFPHKRGLLRAWGGASLAALAFAAWVSVSDFAWFYDPTSLGKRVEEVNRNAVSRTVAPRVVILGTSRAAFGLAPAIIEREMQLPAQSVANWAYPGFGVEAFSLLLAAHQGQIARAELIVICIDPYFALEKEPVPIAGSVVERNWAVEIDQALRQRLSAIFPVQIKTAWFLRELGHELRLADQYSLNWRVLKGGNWGISGHGSDRSLAAVDAQAESEAMAVNYFKDKTASTEQIAKWKGFLHLLRSLNNNVILIDLPMSHSFMTASERYAPAVEENRSTFEKLAGEYQIRGIRLTNVECGLDDDMFADPVHTNGSGTDRLSKCVGRLLRDEL
jgi:hypothetical protein